MGWLKLHRAWRRWALEFVLVATFVVVRFQLTDERAPQISGDGHIWLRAARESIFSSKFWLGSRPPTLSLLFRLVDGSDTGLVLLATVVATASWVTLALVVARFTSTLFGAALSLLLVLALGLTTPVLCWDAMIRSESIGLSMFVLCFAAVLNFGRLAWFGAELRWRIAWALTALASGGLSVFARETNSYLLPLLALLVLGSAGGIFPCVRAPARRSRRFWGPALLLALSLVAVAWTCQATTRASGRYAFPLMNVIFMRVLPAPRKLAYFRDELALPVSPALMERRSHWASADERTAFHAPELAEFRGWIHQQGYAAYERYLLSHFAATVAEAARYFPSYASADFSRMARTVARHNPCDAVFVRGPVGTYPGVTLGLCLLAGLALLFARTPSTCLLALAVLFGVAAVLTQTYVCYHGDAMETERHGMLIGTLLRLLAVMTCIAGVTWLERPRAPLATR